MPQTLLDKIWARHRVLDRDDGQALLYIDKHLVQDGSAPAFEMLRQRGLKVRTPERAFAVPDHYVPTGNRDRSTLPEAEMRAMSDALESDSAAAGIPYFKLEDARQGIVHVVAPEQGMSQPGMLIVCGDSHTPTHGAVGALAFGIGATEVAHVLATQTLWQKKPKSLRITIDGTLGTGVSAKDVILAIIAKIGAAGAVGHVIEYAGSAVRAMSMEGRFTLCNMAIEAGGRGGLVAPDEITFAYLKGRPHAPGGTGSAGIVGDSAGGTAGGTAGAGSDAAAHAVWDQAVAQWRSLPSDADAVFDREVTLNAADIAPMVTWGNSPEDALPVTGHVPDPAKESDPQRRAAIEDALDYMGLTAGAPLISVTVNRVFIGSCTNGRIEDLRAAAAVARGRKVASGVEAWVVPGSGLVKAEAEREGLDRVFLDAGFQWRHPGCSMCIGTNGDRVAAGQRSASTSNRNFRGRQGPGARTHLMSPAMAAAAAVTGHLTDARTLMTQG